MTLEEVPTGSLEPHHESDNVAVEPTSSMTMTMTAPSHDGQSNEHVNSTITSLDNIPLSGRSKPLIHSPVDPPVCNSCQQLDLIFFNPMCDQCQAILLHQDTSIPQIFAILRQWTPETQQNLELLIREVLKRGAHINDRDGLTDMTLLHYASKSAATGIGDIEEACRMVHLLLSAGADVFVRCRWTNMTALHYAVYFDVAPIVEILLTHSSDKDINLLCRDFDNGGPLHIACANLCVNVVALLLQRGADQSLLDGQDRTPRDCLPDSSVFDSDSEMLQLTHHIHSILDQSSNEQQITNDAKLSAESNKALQAAGLQLGGKVMVGGVKSGILRYCGPTEFASGIWTGIELDDAVGKNDGSVMGVHYFHCLPKHGIFAPVSKVSRPGILVHNRSPMTVNTPRNISHKKVDTSHVSAKVDTGLSRARQGSADILDVGERVLVAGQRRGVIKYSGEANFAPGWWYGIELDRPVGKNDGSVNGHRFFTCKPKYGVFAPPSRVQKIVGSSDSLDDSYSALMGSRNLASAVSQPVLNNTPRNKSSRPKSSGGLNRSFSGNQSSEFKLCEGMSVFCSGELGVIRYIGHVDFAEGVWLGVELRTPKGRNDGSIQGQRYFTCRQNHGLLVRPSKVTVRGINGAKLLKDYYTGAHTSSKTDLNISS